MCTSGFISVRPAPALSGEGGASVHEWAPEGAAGARKGGAGGRCGKGGKAGHLVWNTPSQCLIEGAHHAVTTLGSPKQADYLLVDAV